MAQTRNIAGSIESVLDDWPLIELLAKTEIGGDAFPVGHYDGSTSVMLPAAGAFRFHKYPGQSSWYDYGHIDGGPEEASRVAERVGRALSAVGIPYVMTVHESDEGSPVVSRYVNEPSQNHA